MLEPELINRILANKLISGGSVKEKASRMIPEVNKLGDLKLSQQRQMHQLVAKEET